MAYLSIANVILAETAIKLLTVLAMLVC